MIRCIWCKQANESKSIEHIIPEALGCPTELVLSNGAVCTECNNGLAHLDQTVSDDFDVIAYMAGVTRKKGRLAEVRNRGNLLATNRDGKKDMSINMERASVQGHDGAIIGAFGKSPRNVEASFEVEGQISKVSFSTKVGQNPKFVRGIVKIAFSILAYFLGSERALSAEFDPVRRFVREGHGQRYILLVASPDLGYRNQAWPPFQTKSGDYTVTFRLAAMEFCVDLSATQTGYHLLKAQAEKQLGQTGWGYLPIDS